jgi:hypothetical protein
MDPPAPPEAPVTPSAPTAAPEEKKSKKQKGKGDGAKGGGDPTTPDPVSKAATLGGEKGPEVGVDAKAADKYGHLEIHGRLFARATLSTRPVEGAPAIKALDFSLPSARLGFKYQSPLKWLSAEMEAELTSRTPIRDGFVQARKRFFTVKAGQFKVPISAIELESAFSLPTVDRGLLHDYLLDVLQVGGRRLGASVELHDRDTDTGLRPTLTLAGFQGSTVGQDGTFRDIEDETLRGQSFAARVELRPGDFTFGLSYEHRVGPERVLVVDEGGVLAPALGRPSGCKEACSAHYYTFGADAGVDAEFSGTGLRLWLDGLAGRSWFESSFKRMNPANALEPSFPVFGSVRAIAAFRVGGMTRRDVYVEPYAMAGLLDPDLSYGKDHVTEWMLGVNVGRWKLARVGLEGSIQRGAARLPRDFNGDPDRMSLMLQGALAF